MTTTTPNDSTLEIRDITNGDEEEEEEEEQNVEAEQDTGMTGFVKQNYTTLKRLLEEHERTEKLKGAAEDVLNMARRTQRSEGGMFYTPHNKSRAIPVCDGTTSMGNAGSNSGAEQRGKDPHENERRIGQKTLPRRMGDMAGARKVLFNTDDDIQILDKDEDESEEEREPERRVRKTYEPLDADLIGPYQRRFQSRFTTRIATAPKPSRLKMPSHIKTYDGLSDPDDHMSLFCAAAENHRDWTMPVWCHMFEQTLKGPARLWFNSLQPSSIDSFDELQERFETQFQHQRRYERDPVEIHNIKQGENESILDFLRRFNRESMEIGGATESMRVSGYMHAIRNKQLIEQLNRVVPKTMKEAEQRSRDFVRGKEAAALTEGQRKKDGRDNTPWRKEGINRRHGYLHQSKGQVSGNTSGGRRKEPL